MAKRYRKRYNNYRGKSSRRTSNRSNGGMGIYNPGNEFLAGLIGGYLGIVEKHVPDEIVLTAAVAPVKGARAITNGAKGVICGRLARARFGQAGKITNTGRGF